MLLSCLTLSEIDRKEVRINAMRSAILETFPEPNRRLLQRYCFLMFTIILMYIHHLYTSDVLELFV